MRLAWHVARIGDKCIQTFVGNVHGKRPGGGLSCIDRSIILELILNKTDLRNINELARDEVHLWNGHNEKLSYTTSHEIQRTLKI
jgi:hypothetical protein